MDLVKYISVLVVFLVSGGDTGGHGESHHDHVKLHVPEFIHHDHHTKVITIHHHHHKPKEKHHHHHHHHHHKPHVPYGHHYHKNHKKTNTKTHTSASSHGQGQHGHLSHGHGSHGRHGHNGHQSHHGLQGHVHKHQDPPTFNYEPNPVTFEDDYKSFQPSAPPSFSQTPQVYGVEHTVKQVKVFDSLSGALPSNTASHGYQVTEEGEQSDDDAFSAINTLPQSYPGTFGFVRSVEDHPDQNDVFADFPVQSSLQASQDPFAGAPQPTSYGDVETFSTGQADPFSSLAPTHDISPSISTAQFPGNIQVTGFDDPTNVYPGDITSTALLSTEDALHENTPVSFAREAGIQQTVNTGGVETFLY